MGLQFKILIVHLKVIELFVRIKTHVMCIIDFTEISIYFLSDQQFKMKLFLKVDWSFFSLIFGRI